MRRLLLILLFALAALHLPAQYKIRFVVKDLTETKRDSIFIAGNFNSWNPAPDNKYKLAPYGQAELSIVLNLPAGHYEYKYHGGGWLKVEKHWSGGELDNRRIDVTKDTIIHDEVAEWRDLVFKNKRLAIARAIDDTTKIGVMISIASAFGFNADYTNTDSALYYINQALQLLEDVQLQNKSGRWVGYIGSLMYASDVKSLLLHSLGDYPKALELHFRVLQLAQENNDSLYIPWTMLNIAGDYSSMKDYSHCFDYCRKAQAFYSLIKRTSDPVFSRFDRTLFGTLAHIYNDLNIPDSTFYYARRMFQAGISDDIEQDVAGASHLLGDNYAARGLPDSAFYYYRLSLLHASNTNMTHSTILSLKGLAELFEKKGQVDSALYYARAAMSSIQNNRSLLRAWGENPETYLADLSPLLADLYNIKQEPDSAYKYLQLSVQLKDSLFNADKQKQLQSLTFTESMRQQQEAQKEREAKQKYETRMKMYGLIGGILVLLLFAIILFRNNKQKQRSNTILQGQKKDIENTLAELRNTQKQLIQSEKMASLGELTAGIAHEIQNPLNFVNNFSELSNELIDEMKQELTNGNELQAMGIADNIKQNLEKITHHGKRADAIVKGMLQHSQARTGQKQLTDINKLADEYLRLSYHGLRAKDSSFNSLLQTDFDQAIEAINIIPQEIGRVLLNLYNNAFYAVNEKKKQRPEIYEPTVSVSTKKIGDKSNSYQIEIRVTDNGNGIPQNIMNKIFQPFFTTKPTGQGTGLGLSLSYDIVKAHSGELKVETKEGVGSEFVIVLPC